MGGVGRPLRGRLCPELKRIVYKTTGIGDVLREALAAVAGVQAAFIYGSVARDTERATSDIDLFILGVPDRAHLDAALSEAEDRLGREVSLVTMTADEWHARAAAYEGFIEELRRSPKIYLREDAPDYALTIAHQAIYLGCVALMTAHGCRPRVNGHHMTALRFARLALLDQPDILGAQFSPLYHHDACHGSYGAA